MLKASQIYPEAYGREVHSLWEQSKNENIDYMPHAETKNEMIDHQHQAHAIWANWRSAHNQVDWSTAALSDLAAFLGLPEHFRLCEHMWKE